MDITWAAIFKVIIAGLVTYVLLPAALILRDWLLWHLINIYILNDNLRKEVRRYAFLAQQWNEEFAGKREFDGDKFDEGLSYLKRTQDAQEELQKCKLYIDRKSRFLTWLLRHYKQEAVNPIGEWKKQAAEEMKRRSGESS